MTEKLTSGADPQGRLIACLVVLFFSGLMACAGGAPTVKVSDPASRELRQKMKIYTPAQLDEGSVERLGPVNSTSCANTPWESASEEDAVDQLLYKASQAGGTGIADVSCQKWGSNNLENKCWSSYTCTAAIVKASGAALSSATGFVISADGHILTSSHVVTGAKSIAVTFNGETLPASVVRDDTQNDLAIIKVDRPSAPLEFRDDGRLRAGDAVTIIGFPVSSASSKEPHVITGNITALSGLKDDVRFLQFSAPVEPGDSGSPVFDESGRVIAIAVSQPDALKSAPDAGSVPQNVSLAIKASMAKALMDANGINFVVSQRADRRSVSDVTGAARNAIVSIESR